MWLHGLWLEYAGKPQGLGYCKEGRDSIMEYGNFNTRRNTEKAVENKDGWYYVFTLGGWHLMTNGQFACGRAIGTFKEINKVIRRDERPDDDICIGCSMANKLTTI